MRCWCPSLSVPLDVELSELSVCLCECVLLLGLVSESVSVFGVVAVLLFLCPCDS